MKARLLWLILVSGLAAGCSREAVPVRYGQDECAFCKMTLVDQRFGAELVTAKGKVLIFDDLACLFRHQRANPAPAGNGARVFVIDFAQPAHLVPAEAAHYLLDDRLRSPMGGGIAAFGQAAEREQSQRQLGGGGRLLRWAELPRNP
jgi:copper chaperone NosL